MKIISVYFDYAQDKRYSTMAEVLKYTAKKYCPECDFELIKLKAPMRDGPRSFTSNTVKMDCWIDLLNNSDDDVLFLDCDMIILQNLHSVLSGNYDIGITKRTKSRVPYNGGFVVVKNNDKARDFMLLWQDVNTKMYKDRLFHSKWRNKYAGMNQAALGYILEKEKFLACINYLPCKIWNSCDDDWKFLNAETKVIHIKGNLRRAIFSCSNNLAYRRPLILWNNHAVEAGIINSRKMNVTNIFEQETVDIVGSPSYVHSHLVQVRGLRRRTRRRVV